MKKKRKTIKEIDGKSEDEIVVAGIGVVSGDSIREREYYDIGREVERDSRLNQ